MRDITGEWRVKANGVSSTDDRGGLSPRPTVHRKVYCAPKVVVLGDLISHTEGAVGASADSPGSMGG